MISLAELQQQMMAYLVHGESQIESEISDQGDISKQTRLAIYRNAYQVRLTETIDTDHELTGIYLGDELFDQLCTGYIEQHSSSYFSLRHFCDHLPEYLAQHETFKDHPQIAELARFERALLNAFDAKDEVRASLENLQTLPVESWPDMKIEFHASLNQFVSGWNVIEIWQALKAETAPPEAQQRFTQAGNQGDVVLEHWLLWRNHDRLTEFKFMSQVEIWMYAGLTAELNFAAVCESLIEILPEDEIGPAAVNTLTQWLNLGMIRAISS